MFIPNIIIGAGPAGIQLGALFEEQNISYKIFERAEHAGSFFRKFPLSGKLISINKWNTGNEKPEFNLRHDWNSLLSEKKLLFKEYSEDYYPDRKDLSKYLQDFADKHELNIQYDSKVNSVAKKNGKYLVRVQHNSSIKEYECEKLIIATGLSVPNMPKFETKVITPIKHYGHFEKDSFLEKENLKQYQNKSVLIFGGGNAAHELGNILNPICSSVSIVGRSHKDWAMSTHYVGDLRSVYLPFMDTFLLKSLNTVSDGFPMVSIDQPTKEDKYHISAIFPQERIKRPFFNTHTSSFDHVIFCTGWKFDSSIFQFDMPTVIDGKYPGIYGNYECVIHENLFFIGSLMHSLDYKMSSGGFIHGFRYLLKHFMMMNYNTPLDITYFKQDTLEERLTALTQHCMEKINTSSALYQMYGQICDIFFYDETKKEFTYYNNVSIHMIRHLTVPFIQPFGCILTLEYGKTKVTDIKQFGQKVSNVGTESNATLLHPVLRVVNKDSSTVDLIHFDEDIFANFHSPESYTMKFLRTLRMFYT